MTHNVFGGTLNLAQSINHKSAPTVWVCFALTLLPFSAENPAVRDITVTQRTGKNLVMELATWL